MNVCDCDMPIYIIVNNHNELNAYNLHKYLLRDLAFSPRFPGQDGDYLGCSQTFLHQTTCIASWASHVLSYQQFDCMFQSS